jgi:quinoprotein glucose dehydrogenase
MLSGLVRISRFLFFSIAVCSFLAAPFGSAAELGGSGGEQIDYSTAREEAQQAIKKFRVAPGFKVDLFAHEPQLFNPVAFCLDEQGRIYVSETGRYRSSTLDVRHYMDWYLDDLACRTVEDRVAMIRKYFGRDYKKLASETETIRLVEDRDGDGLADFSQVYAGGFTNILDGIASGVLARKGDVYFTNIPNLWKLKDTNQDGVADERESLSYGYGVRFSLTGHDLHGMKFGPDGKLYFTVGDRGANVMTQEGTQLRYPDEGICFRCNSDGSQLEVVARGLRNPQELAFNEYGDLFTGDNDCDHGDKERWVHIVEGGDSGWRVGYQFSEQNPGGVWNAEGLWHLRFPGQAAYLLPPLAHIDNGPSGLSYYPGTGLPAAYNGHFFLCHFKGLDTVSGIKMFSLQPKGASFSVGEMKELIWNVMPTDVDFGPDGHIYLSDWVYGWPKSERGRIYRLHHPDTVKSPIVKETQRRLAEGMDHLSEENLGGLLAHPDMRVRQEAQFEFADRGRSAIRSLVRVLKNGENQFARIHAIWGLVQIADQRPANRSILGYLVDYIHDSDAEIRAQVAKGLGGGFRLKETSELLKPLLEDSSLRVRFFASMSLGKLGQSSSHNGIVSMLRENNDQDLYLRHAGVMALAGIGDHDALKAASRDESTAVRMAVLLAYRKMEDQGVSRFLSDSEPLLAVEAARAINDVPIPSAMPSLADALAGFDSSSFRSDLARETDLVTPMVRRMVNANFRLGTTKNLTALVAFSGKPEISEALRSEALERIGEWSDPSPRDKVLGLYRPIAVKRATDVKLHVVASIRELIKGNSTTVAVAATDAAGKLNVSELEAELLELVTDIAGETELRVAALNALSRLGSTGFDEAMDVARLDFAVELRKAATRLQANVDPSIAAPQLNAVLVDGSVGEQQVALATLATMDGSVSDEIILRWFGKYVDGTLPAALALDVVDAAEVRSDARIVEGLEKWRASIPENDSLGEMKIVLEGGNEEAGRRVFLENPVASCTRCHRVGDVGSDIGPSMDGIGARLSREQLVESIVFPNRTIAEGFETVVVTMNDEEVHAGILKTESDDELVLNTVDQGAVRVSKGDIQSRDTGVSGMPEGFIDILSKQDIRDLVEYLLAKK